jgi:hypothetical protein
MSTQKRLSHLSIAAAALLTVAVPAFAQTKSADSATELTTSSRQVVAFNSERIVNPFDSLNRTSESVSGLATSAAPANPKLMASQFSINESNLGFTKPQSKSYEIRFDEANNQLSADTLSGSSAKGLTFVPSRGPKFPW